jgi:NADH-quinone oxidoreductase subunit N
MMGQWGGFSALMPVVLASGWAILVLVAEMFSSSRRYRGVGWLSIVGLAHVAYVACCGGARGAFGSAIALDGFTAYFVVLAAALTAVCVLAALDYLDLTEIVGGEYYPLLFFAFVGIIVMAAATDLIVLFVGLETMSMAVYVLAGIWKRDARSNEAALKYFVMGAFASGFMLYGIALLYGATGSTVLAEIASGFGAAAPSNLALLGMGMLTVGLAFKVSAVPFHLWTPDVYEGAPTSVTAFMSTAVKAAGFAAAVRVLSVALAAAAGHLELVLSALAVVTMTVGNFVALRQTSLKRMLAYSSIAHTGYLLVGLAAGTTDAAAAILFYLAAYGAMNIAAFAVLMSVARRGEQVEEVADLAGLGTSRPLIAAAMTIAMLSLTGIPPLGGFTAKLYLFTAALDAGKTGLVLVALGNSVVSAAYYLGVVKTMYFDPAPAASQEAGASRPHLAVALAIAIAVTILLGVSPSAVLDAAANAMEGVLTGAAG